MVDCPACLFKASSPRMKNEADDAHQGAHQSIKENLKY